MKHLLRALYILFETCLLIIAGLSIFGVVYHTAVIMEILYSILTGVSLSGFITILILLIVNRDYVW